MIFYIIEHPTRGTFRDWNDLDKPSFSWSGRRDDPETAYRFPTQRQAELVLSDFPHKIKKDCKILRSPAPNEIEYKVVSP